MIASQKGDDVHNLNQTPRRWIDLREFLDVYSKLYLEHSRQSAWLLLFSHFNASFGSIFLLSVLDLLCWFLYISYTHNEIKK